MSPLDIVSHTHDPLPTPYSRQLPIAARRRAQRGGPPSPSVPENTAGALVRGVVHLGALCVSTFQWTAFVRTRRATLAW